MGAIKKAIDRHRYISALVFVIIGLAVMMALSACGAKSAVSADPNASSAAVEEEVVEEPDAVTPPPVNNLIKQFGETVTYDDGVSISVAFVGPFTPSNLDYMPLAAGETAVLFKVVVTNNSGEVLEPSAVAQANSGGKPATTLADIGNPDYGDIGLFPTTSILPGQTLEWFVGFGVADPENITFEIAPAVFGYESAIFANVPF